MRQTILIFGPESAVAIDAQIKDWLKDEKF